jgi:autotransporter-associated beta strand protein
MALTQYVKNNTTTTTLNNGSVWVGGLPPPSAATSQAAWTSASGTVSNALGASTTWGQILVTGPSGTCTISATVSTVLTLTPTDTSANNIGIDMSAATQNFTITEPIALGSSQEWKVAANRTLTVGGIVSGAFSLSKTNPGALVISNANTFGGAGQTFAVNEGQVFAQNGNALGSSLNTISVSSNANLNVSAAISQTALTVSGAGFTGGTGYGAFTTTNALTSSQVITLGASGTVLTINASTFAAQIATAPGVTSITLNMLNSAIFSTASSYTASGGVRIQSIASNGTTRSTARYSFGTGTTASDTGAAGNGLGNVFNPVIVETTGAIVYSPVGGTLTLSRNYEFLASTSPTNQQCVVNSTSIMDFAGTVTLTGSAGQAASFIGTNLYGNLPGVKFSGTITGAADLWVGRKAASNGAVSTNLGADLVSSAWTGTLYADAINYYGGGTSTPTFPVVFFSTNNFINAIGNASANHSSYSKTASSSTIFNPTSIGQTGNLTLGGGAWSSAPGTWLIDAGTLTLNFGFTGAGAFTKTGASTLVLGGNNTGLTALALSTGTLVLNSAGSAGPSAATFIFATGTTINSTVGATLNQNGAVNAGALAGTWTWVGTNDLTFGTGNVDIGGDRVIAFGAGGGLGTLKFRGNVVTTAATISWNFGGSTAGAKQRVTLGGANGSLSDGTAANQHAVTAGYFRIENNNGLGAAGTTTAWWVGATNLGVQTTKAALELAGVTTPDTKNVNLYNIGPNDDGALIGVSGTSVFSGAISVPNVAGTHIGVKSSATLTLLGSGIYPNLNPTNSGTPLAFTAESGGTLNQNRILGSNVSTVTVTGGSGTVVFSRANTHAGTMTCSAGTTKVANVNATSTGSVTVSAGATLESTVQSQFQSTLSLGTLSSASRAILKFAA